MCVTGAAGALCVYSLCFMFSVRFMSNKKGYIKGDASEGLLCVCVQSRE